MKQLAATVPGARPARALPAHAGGRGAAPELTQADYQRLARLRQLLRRFLVFSENAAARAGLTAQQHQAMLAIKGFGGRRPVTTGALAGQLGIRHHSAVGLVDRLVAKGLARRRHGSADRRQVFVELTPKAEGVLRQLTADHRDELEQLAPLLRILLAHFEPQAPR